MVDWAHPSSQPKQHLDRFSHFYRADEAIFTGLTTVTYRDHATRSMIIGRFYLCMSSTAMWPNKINEVNRPVQVTQDSLLDKGVGKK